MLPRRIPVYTSMRFRRASLCVASRNLASVHGPQKPLPDGPLPLHRKLLNAWRDTPTKWYPLPVAVGALLLVALQFKKRTSRETEVGTNAEGREVVRLKGPWQVHVLGALPLRNLSRLWGYLNSLELPVWFRPFGFRLYAFLFSINLSEIEPDDLTQYASLGEFFYRRLKPGVRPIAAAPIVSPADGRMLHCGEIIGTRIEQVKGLSYSVDALLGVPGPDASAQGEVVSFARREQSIVDDKEFANVNGIQYSLDQLMGDGSSSAEGQAEDLRDESVRQQSDSIVRDASVAFEMGAKPTLVRTSSISDLREGHNLYFVVIYLAPGDYHRFHSPAAWVVQRRRHFTGELFSVSPYMAKRLANLFVLNERVALLGRWRYGFFGMVPVGATNVGSIKIAFDEALRTNARGRSHPPGTYTEAVYSAASPILGGQPLQCGQEMGGFSLGSTIVLVFEAPAQFNFTVSPGQRVQVGEELGSLVHST